jgi:hypothetical protein
MPPLLCLLGETYTTGALMQYPNTQVQHIRVENTLSNSLLPDGIEVKY